ncbi:MULTISPECIES: GTPase HflX [Halomicrobium]|uniref:GTPase HflX n=2 Tax=Halomicrobium mukohataei TaxID=57705 RepID=C7NY54_HALMD|nr:MULTISPECIES: GTPase HflX [Halomicrobium]ACV48514.1 GTP-binding proten HflX [Halomicrobium mukohataei DSM 12286]QCD66915.1 GTPase HflX [Halomicrobium mukohataei]QFR21725.1 GTPase HflX [Halomicrobium sp. ZPS1]
MTASTTAERAVIAKRVDSGTADTEEITDLARAAGYEAVGEVTQKRTEDPAYHLGEGKVARLANVVAREGATAVIFDNELGPYQTYNIGNELPDGVQVVDRFRLILEIFGQRAQTRKAQLQVELAELRYELPRAEAKASLAKRDERPGFMGLGEYDESREEDIKKQISRIRDELASIEETEQHRRQQRRESGFDLVALAGYTNAGKSTLLRRVADDVDVDENEELHPDLDPTAESEDRLFTTLGTTTRRADMDQRDVLVTDTVGFISDLPHWLVESFKSTLDAVYRADLVLLVVDVSEPVEEIREKLVTSHDTLYERNEAPIVTVLNKTDTVDDAEIERKRAALSGLAPNPIAVSAKEGANVDALLDRIHDELPDYERERLVLPMTDETMSLVSWIHDHAHVDNVDYGDQVIVEFEGRSAVVERSRAKAGELVEASA